MYIFQKISLPQELRMKALIIFYLFTFSLRSAFVLRISLIRITLSKMLLLVEYAAPYSQGQLRHQFERIIKNTNESYFLNFSG